MAALSLSPLAFGLDPSKLLSQYELTSWSRSNGLSQISVMSVAQTPDGYLWMATEEGLVRFDGTTFVTFDEHTTPQLPDRYIRSLATAPDGSLWIGTRSGIAILRHGSFKNLQRETNFEKDVYDLCVSRDGTLWFSSEEGLHRFGKGSNRIFTVADGFSHNGITAIAEAPDGAIWVGTRLGLARLLNDRFTAFGPGRGFPSLSVNSLTVDRHGDVWFGTLDGAILKLHEGEITKVWRGHAHSGVRAECLREDHDGNLWAALSHFGLLRISGDRVSYFGREDGLPSSNPDWVFESSEHSLWIGWADAGLSSLRDGKFLNFGVQEGLSSNHVSSILQARDGSFWVGTEDAGVDHLIGTKIIPYSRRQGLYENSILALAERRNGSIWVGSQDGAISRIENGEAHIQYEPHRSPPPRLPAMLEDKSQNLWVGYEVPGGLTLLRGSRVERIPLRGRVRGLAMDADGSLWVASYNEGLVHVSASGTRVFTEKEGLSSTLVTSVLVDSSGTVWAGTALSGLNRWRANHLTAITEEQGLFDNSIGAIAEDGCGYLWITSSRGLSRVRKDDLNRVAEGTATSIHSESFGDADGLRAQEFSIGAQPAIWKAQDGRLWFATVAGLASIDPRRIQRNSVAPHAIVEGLYLNGRRLDPVAGRRLGPGSGRLEISFSAPSFVAPGRTQVLYKLDGFDSQWVNANTSRRATYTNLSPGTYRFELRAANSDGVWGPTEVLEFEWVPFYYQTLWFRTLAAFLAAIIAALVYQARVKYLRAKNSELESRIAARTADLQTAIEVAQSTQELLREQATKDSLTGLLNRRSIYDLLEEELALCRKDGRLLSVLLIDLDHFKTVNDNHGHLAGDQVLRHVSQVLASQVREPEKVGRYGGEEILILLPGCALEDALRRAEQLRISVSKSRVNIGPRELTVTCSIGVSGSSRVSSVREVVSDADTGLYSAKHAGRNCVRKGTLSFGKASDDKAELGLQGSGPNSNITLNRVSP